MRHTYGGSSQDLNSFLRQCSQRRGVSPRNARSFLARPYTGFPDRRSRPFRINVVITPAVHERTDVNLMLPLASPFSRCREPRQPAGPKRPRGFGARLSVADDVPTLSIRHNSAF